MILQTKKYRFSKQGYAGNLLSYDKCCPVCALIQKQEQKALYMGCTQWLYSVAVLTVQLHKLKAKIEKRVLHE